MRVCCMSVTEVDSGGHATCQLVQEYCACLSVPATVTGEHVYVYSELYIQSRRACKGKVLWCVKACLEGSCACLW